MRYLLALLLICSVAIADDFNDRGVWHPVDRDTLAAGQVKTIGIRDVSDRENEITMLIHGTATTGSLKVWLRLYGMMSAVLKDTSEMIIIFDDSSAVVSDSTIVFADTLSGSEHFPHLYGRLANIHPTNTDTLSFYLYAKPKDVTILRR